MLFHKLYDKLELLESVGRNFENILQSNTCNQLFRYHTEEESSDEMSTVPFRVFTPDLFFCLSKNKAL